MQYVGRWPPRPYNTNSAHTSGQLQCFLQDQRQTGEAFAHVGVARCLPDLHTSRDHDHRSPSTQSRIRPSASVSMLLSTRTRRSRPSLIITSLCFRLTDIDTVRAGNLRDNRARLKAGSDEALFVFAWPAPAAFNRRDDLNPMLRRRTIPDATTRTNRHSSQPDHCRNEIYEAFEVSGSAVVLRCESLNFYLTKLARLGGDLARTSDPPPGHTVVWRGLSRLTDIRLRTEMAATLKCG
ncbi:hypothetical protein AGR6A_pTi0189 [Agrobacterium sp. NCPPB 925]|nr:hypothetical protein AGR6A_pTi0189 [Agrobacterium sp. NCPPB 925]